MTIFEPVPRNRPDRRPVKAVLLFSLLAGALLLTLAAPARADDAKARASVLFKEGNQFRKQRRFDEALDNYREAYRLYPSYKINLNLGLTLMDVGKDAEAARAFQRFIYQEPGKISDEKRALAIRKLNSLKRKLAWLQVTANVNGAIVDIDGSVHGATPLQLPIILEPGIHELVVNAAGFQPFTSVVDLEAGLKKDVSIVLIPKPSSQPVPSAPALAPPDEITVRSVPGSGGGRAPHDPPEAKEEEAMVVLRGAAARGSLSTYKEVEAVRQRIADRWPYRLSGMQIESLLSTGCRFDEVDLASALKLKRRGFTEQQLVLSYKDLYEQRSFNRSLVVEMAAFREAGLSAYEFRQYKASGKGLTDYYNWRIGGAGPTATGVIFLLLGLGGVITGGALYDASLEQEERHDNCNSDVSTNCDTVGSSRDQLKTAGILSMLGGFIFGAVGLPLTISGGVKISRWADPGSLEHDRMEDLQKYRKYASGHEGRRQQGKRQRRGEQEDPAPFSVAIYPTVQYQGAGFGFSVTY